MYSCVPSTPRGFKGGRPPCYVFMRAAARLGSSRVRPLLCSWQSGSGALAEQFLGLGGVARCEHGVAIKASRAGAGLVLVQVHLARLAVHELAATGQPEPLLGT